MESVTLGYLLISFVAACTFIYALDCRHDARQAERSEEAVKDRMVVKCALLRDREDEIRSLKRTNNALRARLAQHEQQAPARKQALRN